MQAFVASVRDGEPTVNEVSASVKNGVAMFDDGSGEKSAVEVKYFGLFPARDGAVCAVAKTQKKAVKLLAEHFKSKMNKEANEIRELTNQLLERRRKMREAHGVFVKIKALA